MQTNTRRTECSDPRANLTNSQDSLVGDCYIRSFDHDPSIASWILRNPHLFLPTSTPVEQSQHPKSYHSVNGTKHK